MDEWLQQIPPWRAFPDLPPAGVGARQGAQEAWVDGVWRPFWAQLSADQRTAYFAHWQTSDEWQHAIRATFERPNDLDIEADAAESQAWLRQHANERTSSASWRQRLGRLFGKP